MLAILYLQHDCKQEIWVLTIKDFFFFFFFFRKTNLDKYVSLYFGKPVRTGPASELSSILYSAKKIKQILL